MCYIADVYCEGGKKGVCGELHICRDEGGQSVNLSYSKNDGTFSGEVHVSNNSLYHVSEEDMTDICIFRNRRIIFPKYVMNNENKRCCCRRIQHEDMILLMTKDNSMIFKEYLAELFYVNNKRRNKKKEYMSFMDMFEHIRNGEIFGMILCLKK